MDHYPKVNLSERSRPSHRSSASPTNKSPLCKSLPPPTTKDTHPAPPQYTSFPSPSDAATHARLRNDSVHSTTDIKPASIEAQLARYTDAPPPYSEKQYAGKSEDERAKMRMGDYAKELSRMMGWQLARGLKGEKK